MASWTPPFSPPHMVSGEADCASRVPAGRPGHRPARPVRKPAGPVTRQRTGRSRNRPAASATSGTRTRSGSASWSAARCWPRPSMTSPRARRPPMSRSGWLGCWPRIRSARLPQAYSDGPEGALNDQKLGSYIAGPEQWRPFLRWAVALGCAELVPGRQPTAHPARSDRRLSRGTAADPARGRFGQRLLRAPSPRRCRSSTAAGSRTSCGTSGPSCADPRGDAMVGPAFSLALRRLQGQGVIGLHREADADYRVDGVLHGQRWTFDRVTRRSENGDA